MMPDEVAARFEHRRARSPHLCAYALVDGLQFSMHAGKRIGSDHGSNRALFAGTQDESLAHAGPWLYDLATAEPATINEIARLEQAAPAVLWIFASLDLDSLALVLQLKLDVKLPDGKIALMRFWDPRVLVNLFNALDLPARQEYFAHVEEWHGQLDGKRYHISVHA